MIKHAFDPITTTDNSCSIINLTPLTRRAGIRSATWASPGVAELYRLSPAAPLPLDRHDLNELAWAVALTLNGQLPALTCPAIGGQLQLLEYSGFINGQREVQCIRLLLTTQLDHRGKPMLIISLPDEVLVPTSRRVLLVEDDPQIGGLLCRLLRRDGFEAIWLDRGINVVTVAEEQQPDVIVLDVDLPDASGITLGRQLKALASTQNIPFLFASGNYEARAEAMQLGARDFLEKPIELIQLPQRLHALFGASGAT